MIRVEHNFFDDLLVVLVLYKMRVEESPTVVSLTGSLQAIQQKVSIFIYDNSPLAHNYTLGMPWSVTYVNDYSNPGVGKAYNKGFQCAKAQNKKWMLLVDQDSEFENDFFRRCKEAIEGSPDQKLIVPIMMDKKGIVSPFDFRFGRGLRLKQANPGSYKLSEKKFINSGMLISTDLFEAAGGYDERFKLDFSDLAFIERLKAVTHEFCVIDSTGNHSLFTTKDSSSKEALARFKIYCQSANLLGNQTGNLWVYVWKHLRAIVFSIRYFDWRFILVSASTK